MKLRIFENSIRLRLLQTEVRQLADIGSVSASTRMGMPSSAKFRYALETIDETTFSVRHSADSITVGIPRRWIDGWEHDGRVGFSGALDFGDETLQVLVEKDFKCLTARPGEDESDAYPNPEGQTGQTSHTGHASQVVRPVKPTDHAE